MVIVRSEQDRQRCLKFVLEMPLLPVKEVDISEYKPNRTLRQNRAFHAWCKALSDGTGYTEKEIKDKLVLAVFEPEIRKVKVKRGNEFEEITLIERKSTAKLTIEEFNKLQDETLIVAHKVGVQLEPYRE